MEGITNTDLMAETLIFENGIVLDTTEFIQDFDFKRCSDIFHCSFLNIPLKILPRRDMQDLKRRKNCFRNRNFFFFNDFQTSLCMKTYLIREVTGIIVSDNLASQKLIQPDLFNALTQKLFSIKDLPPLLIPALLYQSVWNITYSFYHKRSRKVENFRSRRRIDLLWRWFRITPKKQGHSCQNGKRKRYRRSKCSSKSFRKKSNQTIRLKSYFNTS